MRAARFRGNNAIPLLVVFGFMSAPLPALASRLLYLEQYQFHTYAGAVAMVSATALGGNPTSEDVPTLVCYASGTRCDQAAVVSPTAGVFQIALGDSLDWGYTPADRTVVGDGGNPGVEPGVYTRGALATLTLVSLTPTDVVYAFQYDFDGRSSGFVIVNDGYLPTVATPTAVTTELCFIGAKSCEAASYYNVGADLLEVQAGATDDETWGFSSSDGVTNPLDTPGVYTRGSLATLTVIGPEASGTPEPATWSTVLLGFSMIGGALRGARRRRRGWRPSSSRHNDRAWLI